MVEISEGAEKSWIKSAEVGLEPGLNQCYFQQYFRAVAKMLGNANGQVLCLEMDLESK